MKTSLVLFIIANFVYIQIKEQAISVTQGSYPKAIEIDNKQKVLLLHSSGAIILNDRFIDTTQGAIFDNNLKTDLYSNLFRLNADYIILVKEINHVIVSIYRENFSSIKVSNHFSIQKKKTTMYQFAIVKDSPTLDFLISFDNQLVKYSIDNNQGFAAKPSVALNGISAISCDYCPTSQNFLCAYLKVNPQTTDSNLVYGIYSLTLVLIPNSEITLNNNALNPIVKLVQNTSFAICFYELYVTLKCIQVLMNSNTLVTSDNQFSIKTIEVSVNNNMNLMVLGSSLFLSFKYDSKMGFINLSSQMKTIVFFADSEVIPTYQSPFIFNINKSLIGYVFFNNLGSIQNNQIYSKNFALPTCEDKTEQNRSFSNGVIILKQLAPGEKYIFYQFPLQAMLSQDSSIIDIGNSYSKNAFQFETLSHTGIAMWLFGIIDSSNQVSLLCKLTLTICESTCQTCTDPSDFTKCDTCIPQYFKKTNTNQCFNDKTIEDNYYFDTPTYFPCYVACKTCAGAGTPVSNNCKSCEVGYYPFEDKITECRQGLQNKYYFDNTVNLYKLCYYTCDTCTGAGTSQINNCVTCITPNYGLTNTNCFCQYKWYMKEGKENCLSQHGECPSDYPLLFNQLECVKSCSPFNNDDCLTCQKIPLFENNNKECVQNCPIGFHANFEDYKCVKNDDPVPPDPPDPPEEPEVTDPPGGSRLKVYEEKAENNCYDTRVQLFNKYFQLKANISEQNGNVTVDLIYYCLSAAHSIAYYNLLDTDIKFRVYKKYNVSEINFNSIVDDVKNASATYVMQIDKYREAELTNQTEYYLFDIDSKQVTPLKDNAYYLNIIVPIHPSSYSNLTLAESMYQNNNIDIFNQSSLFFNNICFKYTDANSRDVLIEKRRADFFNPKELCQPGCNYTSFNYFNGYKINCKCLFNQTTEWTLDTVPNPPTPPFSDKDVSPYTAVGCLFEVFKLNDILHNVSFWIFLGFVIAIIVLAFCFICTGMTYANKYIIDVLRASNQLNTNQSLNLPLTNPPPKSKDDKKNKPDGSDEESSHTQIEEEEFDDVKINNFQKKEKARLRQNFMEKLEDSTPNEKTKGERDEKALIMKLRDGLKERTPGVSQDLQKYFFTRNSENESNPNYSGRSERIENETGKSYSNGPINSSFIKEMLIYGEGNEELIDDLVDEEEKDKEKSSMISSKKVTISKKEHSVSQETPKSNEGVKNDFIIPYKPIEMGNKTEMSINKNLSLLNNNLKDKNEDMAKDQQNINQASERDKINSNSPLVNNQSVVNKDDDNDVNVKTPKSFCRAYFNYLKKREIFMIIFCTNKSYLPFFITFPIFLFCLTIMFTIHALFFTYDFIDKGYSVKGGIDFGAWIINEFGKAVYVALIGNAVKIIIIKILIFFVFRIEKKMLSRQNYPVILQRLRCRSATIFVILIVLMGGLFYINTCFCGIFVNTEAGLFIGFTISVVISFFIALILCFIINIIRLIGISCNCA